MWSDNHSFNVSRAPTARLKPSSRLGSPLLFFQGCQQPPNLSLNVDQILCRKRL